MADQNSGAVRAPQTGGAKHRAQALDIIRAFAAMAVLTYHVWLYRLPNPNAPRREGWLDYTLFEWRIGLVVFFVMSGYLLYRPLLSDWRAAPREVSLGRYYWRRVVRIVPAYYLAIIGSIILLWGLEGTPGVRLPPADQLWLFAFFLQNYSRETLLTLDAPTWTLAVQAAFYLVFPLFLFFGSRLGRRARGRSSRSSRHARRTRSRAPSRGRRSRPTGSSRSSGRPTTPTDGGARSGRADGDEPEDRVARCLGQPRLLR